MTLIQFLVKKGYLNKDRAADLEQEVKTTGIREEELILREKIVVEPVLFSLKSELLKIPLKEVDPDQLSLKVLELIPEETARYYQMIALNQKDNVLEVGMVYPDDLKAREALKFLARQGNFNYQIVLLTPTVFKNLLRRYGSLKKEVAEALEKLEIEERKEKIEIKPLTPVLTEELTEEAPVAKMVNVIIRHAVEGNASDIHIEPTREKLRVRFRFLGVLHSSLFLPLKVHPAIVARIKIMSNLKIDETRIPQDGRFSLMINGRPIDFRVSTFPTTLGEKVAIRVLDPATAIKDFEELGFANRNLEVLKEGISKPYGLILVTGPTGSGKSTTLYAILRLLNKEEVNVVTLEDPAEYFIDGINQSQVKPEIGYTFASGLRQILRQDPNIIMVGEIRDEETAALAIHAALTGHIVLSTLHTSNAIGAIPRLVDMGVQPYLIPPTIQLVIAQRLVRRLCDHCKEKVKPSAKMEEFILKEIDRMPSIIKSSLKLEKPIMVYTPKGCPRCAKTGFAGRIGVFEVLKMNPSLAELVLKNPSESAIKKEAEAQGMITMQQDAILKVLQGITTVEEALRVATEK